MKSTADTGYLSIKCAILFAYYSLLQYLGLGLDYKFYSYLILTPIVKYFYFNKLSTSSDVKKFIASVVTDYINGTIYYRYLIHWQGAWFSIYPIVVGLWVALAEYLQFLYLKEKDDNYLVLLSKDPQNAIFIFGSMAIYYWVGLNANYDQSPISPWTFLFWITWIIIFDFLFGIFHYWCHSNPYLFKKHLLHHEYKKEQLNCFAVFYVELLDSIMMNISLIPFAIAVVLCSQDIVVLKELSYCTLHSHHKYPKHQLSLAYFFEFELLDMIMNRMRLTEFHHTHHNLIDQNFSVFGMVDDKWFIKLHNFLSKLYVSN